MLWNLDYWCCENCQCLRLRFHGDVRRSDCHFCWPGCLLLKIKLIIAQSIATHYPGERASILLDLVDIFFFSFNGIWRPASWHCIAKGVFRVVSVCKKVFTEMFKFIGPELSVVRGAPVPETQLLVTPKACIKRSLQAHVCDLNFALFDATSLRCVGIHLE